MTHTSMPMRSALGVLKPQLNGVSFRVLRQILPNAEWKVLTPALTTYPYFNDTTVRTPNTTTCRVVAVYDDARQGVAECAFPNPAPMESPKNLWNQQVGEGRVYLKWEPVNNSYGYKIFGPGLPATGKLVTGISDTISGEPLGSQTYRVATWYLSDGSMATAPGTSVNVVRWTAHYRVMLNGIVVSHATTDGPNDGRGDEIYAAAHVMRYTRTSGNSSPAWSDEYAPPLGQASRQAIQNAVIDLLMGMPKMRWSARVVDVREGVVYVNAAASDGTHPGLALEVYEA